MNSWITVVKWKLVEEVKIIFGDNMDGGGGDGG
jgi:hypothetical protein